MERKQPEFIDAALVIVCFGCVLAYAIIALKAEPHIPMLLGCAIASLAALKNGWRWEEIEQSMMDGISQAMLSIIILLLIGILIGVWICSGTVPAMIYCGLQLLSPRFFLVSCMTICAIVSMALGSWGTAGTIGIAMLGISKIMGIPAEMTAGAVISGCYVGDKISPLADTANLISAVTGVDIFVNIKKMTPLSLSCFMLSAPLYLVVGWKYGVGAGASAQVAELSGQIAQHFAVGLPVLLPPVILLVCILVKIPSIPSVFVGILSAAVVAVAVQHQSLQVILESAYTGYVCMTGNTAIDHLLSAGGITTVLSSISLILAAMMFGGIMERTGLISAFMEPLVGGIRRGGALVGAAVLSCMAVNIILPEQYVAVALPGKMFSKIFEKRGIPKYELTRALGAGGAAFSAMVPWNTCGVFMTGILGVSTLEYFRFAYLNLMIPVVGILLGYARCRQYETIPSKKET